MQTADVHNLVIIGAGPAGYTAAIYAARANLKPLCIEGYGAGGQLMLTTDVENFPGFPHGVKGPELMEHFRAQAERFGTRFETRDVTEVDFSQRPFKIWADEDLFLAKTVIIATGASAIWLGLPSETRLRELGGGVSSCAVCDGAFFKGKRAVVVGGGDTAMEDASYLTHHCSHVTLIHRRDSFRASRIMQERVRNNPKISLVMNSVVEDVLGDQQVTGVRLRNVVSGEISDLETDALFVAIGHQPNTRIFQDKVALDEKGYVTLTHENATNVAGVFAAGDVHDTRYRQAITAAASGCRAAMDAEHFLATHEG